MEPFQSSACINRGPLQIISHHQIPYNLHTFAHTYLFLFVILKIMSTSGQNNAPNAATQKSPFNSETLDYCLVGRLLTNKPVRFMFQFFSYADMERIVQQGSWLFDNFLLVWSKISVGNDPYTMLLDTIECWCKCTICHLDL